MVAENKQLALENEKLRCQIKEERREFHKIISSLETKLEARLNALEANNNATHAISRATVAHSLEGGTAKVDIPQRFSEEAHVSQLQMGEQLQSLRNLMRELQSQQQRAASELREQMMQQMHQMFSEYRKEFAAETEQQRRYVNDSVVGIQRAINKRGYLDSTAVAQFRRLSCTALPAGCHCVFLSVALLSYHCFHNVLLLPLGGSFYTFTIL
ncbi:hypothetical protein HPB51_010241 [Rhipicephalus microplus]|uniref:Uncharacterized protein n=1 Tax=Rhipicephalus microplus TaxID=6941 RepID=A0A9J6EGS8_RHIMP|nr:hypothetical protein HPB51_010241 [Rhipicephalus microplus]